MRFILCKKCKYNFEGECEFHIMGSGNDVDKPCRGEEELVNRAANDFIDAFSDSVKDMGMKRLKEVDMMLKAEVEEFSRLSGEDGSHTSIERVGAFLDGYHTAMRQQWIPCSERLPEEGVPVLGSFEVEGDRFILTTSIFVFDEEKGKSWTGTMGLKPIAWMPLPEPYKDDGDG